MVASDTKLLGDKLDTLIGLATRWQQASVQQQTPPATVLEILSPDAGIGANTRFGDLQNGLRTRGTFLIGFTGANSGILTLFVGLRQYRFAVGSTVRSFRIPFPLIYDAGVDIAAQLSVASAKTTGFLIIGYPEGYTRGQH